MTALHHQDSFSSATFEGQQMNNPIISVFCWVAQVQTILFALENTSEKGALLVTGKIAVVSTYKPYFYPRQIILESYKFSNYSG